MDERAASLLKDGVLTIAEAEELSRMSRTFLYGEMEKGRLAYTKVGARRLISRASLMQMLSANLVAGEAK